MSEMKVYKFLIKNRNGNEELTAEIAEMGFSVAKVEKYPLYFVLGVLSEEEQTILGKFLFSDELFEIFEISRLDNIPKEFSKTDIKRVEVLLKPGVTDTQSSEALRTVKELGFKNVIEIVSGSAYDISGNVSENDVNKIAKKFFCNDVIQHFSIGAIIPHWASIHSEQELKAASFIEKIDIATMSDDELMEFSNNRRAALNLNEMQSIREYYHMENRKCTDAEFEMIAQTWSEHCVHKTFKAKITIDEAYATDEIKRNYPNLCVNNVLKTYIKKATDEINAPWVLSAFVDNAGIIEFDNNYEISFKAETHNHPSAIEPFGGANTGVGGVIRDIMGVSARPFAVTDVFCFGYPDTPENEVPDGSLHPKKIIEGVVSGVEDYGNKMGIPNVNGSVHYHEGYATNPLVYCGCAGIAKRGIHKTNPSIGDHIIAIGGRTGRDGIRGATFSSMVMDASTGDVAGSSVQIGEPIIQKTVCEVLEIASNKELYSAITDCGAGGFSSAIGEMASTLGCDVDLSKAPLKYEGLTGWEIWVSESQERMVLAIPEQHLSEFIEICMSLSMEYVDLGVFTGDGIINIRMANEKLINLKCDFLHSGPPQRYLIAKPRKRNVEYPLYKEPTVKDAVLSLLSHPCISSKEDIVRLYDHEVQGGAILRQYEGVCAEGPQDAAVVQPREIKTKRAVAISNALNFRYGLYDAYQMSCAVIDEAIRNAVAVGTDPDRIGILDNYCMGDPNRPDVMWDLIESARACYDTAVTFGTPFISGKDSFNNEYITADGNRVAIPVSLLISAMGIVPNIDCVPGSDLKKSGSSLYLVGNHNFAWGGSVYSELYGLPNDNNSDIPKFYETAVTTYRSLHQAILKRYVLACHDVSDGGIAIALSEMIIGGKLGATIDLNDIHTNMNEFLFAETCGCLIVEIPVELEESFLAEFNDTTCYKLGVVTDCADFVIKNRNNNIEISYADLRKAFLSK